MLGDIKTWEFLYAEEWPLLQAIRVRFPDEARQTDAWVEARGFEHPHAWLESFADRTTEAIFAEDGASVAAHTDFISGWLLHGSDAVRRLIDVHYAVPLMWNATETQKCWAWNHIAGPVRSLHEEMWGIPRG